jgi:hypothetical protein
VLLFERFQRDVVVAQIPIASAEQVQGHRARAEMASARIGSSGSSSAKTAPAAAFMRPRSAAISSA